MTIVIPAYNAEKTIKDTILSAKRQCYPLKEIIVLDDGSTDNTLRILNKIHRIRVIKNEKNEGIGMALKKLMDNAKGKYVVYLCADDLFTHNSVITDYVKQFDNGDPAVGVIGRYYYEFIGKPDHSVGLFRDKKILTSSVNPSGMAFRKDNIEGTNACFVEMPYIVKQYLEKWRWTMFEYDVVAVRIHPGGNTGTKSIYYKDSAVENWYNVIGIKVKYYSQFIQLKARAPKMLWREIKSCWKINEDSRREVKFWLYAISAVIIPGAILRKLSYFYRDRIQSRNAEIIKRQR